MRRKKHTKEDKEMIKAVRKFRHNQNTERLMGLSHKRKVKN